jgi:hypothetical protein
MRHEAADVLFVLVRHVAHVLDTGRQFFQLA